MLFFNKKRVSADPIYDLRTNQRFTLKERPMTRADLDDFVACYKSGRRHERAETDRFRRFTHADLVARDKVNLDIFWLKDDTLDTPTCCRHPTRSPPRSSRTWRRHSIAFARSRRICKQGE